MFAHNAELHSEATGWWAQLLHQPTWVGLVFVAVFVSLLYYASKLLKLKQSARLLICITGLVIAGVLYMPHNPAVTGIVLSVGFIGTFLFVFTTLGSSRQ